MGFEVTYNVKTGETKLLITKHVLTTIAVGLILSGVAALSSPWWFGIAVDVLESIDFPISEDFQWLFSLVQIAIGIALLLVKHFVIDVTEKHIKLDNNVITSHQINISLLNTYFSQLLDDHSYVSSQDTEFYRSISIYKQVENALQHKQTRALYSEYSNAAQRLHYYIGTNFFIFPDQQLNIMDYRYCMAPQFNEDRDAMPSIDNHRKYTDLTEQLTVLTNDARNLFDKFVADLRKKGHI